MNYETVYPVQGLQNDERFSPGFGFGPMGMPFPGLFPFTPGFGFGFGGFPFFGFPFFRRPFFGGFGFPGFFGGFGHGFGRPWHRW
jgi:hypothetical protein